LEPGQGSVRDKGEVLTFIVISELVKDLAKAVAGLP
jgi:hypothetical protein